MLNLPQLQLELMDLPSKLVEPVKSTMRLLFLMYPLMPLRTDFTSFLVHAVISRTSNF